MLKKRYMLVALGVISVLLGSLFYSNTILAQSGGKYDPWLDYNEDGTINVNDLYPLGQSYGSSGDPTREVYLKHSTYWWTGTRNVGIGPVNWWYFYNTTQGYGQMTFIVKTNSTVDVHVYYRYLLADGSEYKVTIDHITADLLYFNLNPYDISRSSSIQIEIRNYSASNVAEVTLGIYMSA